MSQEGSMMTTEYATRLRAKLVILQEMLQLGSVAFRLDIAEQLALTRARLGEPVNLDLVSPRRRDGRKPAFIVSGAAATGHI